MAVTLTLEQVAGAIRVETPLEEPDTSIVTRLLAVGTELVTEFAPDAPDAVQNEAVIRLAGYLYDQPQAGWDRRYANAIGNSGAYILLYPYKRRRVHVVAEY